MSSDIVVKPNPRTETEAQTIKEGFLGQGFINTMRFSELNGPEEYDNTHLFIDWHALFEEGLKQLYDWNQWILKQKEDEKIWNEVPEDQKKNITRTLADLAEYDTEKSCDDVKNIKWIRNKGMKWNWNLTLGIYVYDGHTGILNGRMARDKGHKKDLLEISRNPTDRGQVVEIGQQAKKHFWQR